MSIFYDNQLKNPYLEDVLRIYTAELTDSQKEIEIYRIITKSSRNLNSEDLCSVLLLCLWLFLKPQNEDWQLANAEEEIIKRTFQKIIEIES